MTSSTWGLPFALTRLARAGPAHSWINFKGQPNLNQGERLDPTEVVSNVELVWDTPYLGLAAGELAPDTLMAASRLRFHLPPRCPFTTVSMQLIKDRPAKGFARKQMAPAFSARARTLSSGNAVMKINGAL